MYVKNCLSGHSWRWIREYSENVSTNSTCNIIIICNGWSICYKCMFPPRGFACMLDEQAPQSHLIACVEVDYIRTRISIQSAPQPFKGSLEELRLGFTANVSVGIWGLEVGVRVRGWGIHFLRVSVFSIFSPPSPSLHTTLCLINTFVTYVVTLNHERGSLRCPLTT